jgi:hypothetical protein
MATEQQEAAKIEQLAHENPDEMEHAAGREREKLEGWIPALATDAEIREALEKAFDYRGDITITRRMAAKVRGLSLRSPHGRDAGDRSSASSHERGQGKVNIAYSDIARLPFTGAFTG